MTLGSVDRDVIQRLYEFLENAASNVRVCLRQYKEMMIAEGLEKSIVNLGVYVLMVRQWYIRMAAEYDWPKGIRGWKVDPDFKKIYTM